MKRYFVLTLMVLMVLGLIGGVALGSDEERLIAHWPFNKGEGDTVEDVVGNNDGTIIGADWTNNSAPVPCNNYALEFDEENDRVVVQNNEDLQLLNGGTIALWVNIKDNTAVWPRLVSKSGQTGTNDGWVFLLDGNNRPRLAMDGVARTTSSNISIEDGWVHLAVTFDGQDWTFYIDGVKDSTFSVSTLPPIDDIKLNIGNEPTANRVFTGILDDVRIYNYALGEGEIHKIYDAFAYIDLEWLPPISLEDFSLNENATLPIKFKVDCCQDKVLLKVDDEIIDLKFDEEDGHFIGLFRPDEAGNYVAKVFCDDVELNSIEFEVRETAPHGRGQGRGQNK